MGRFTFEWGNQKPLSIERDMAGNWFYEMFSSRNSAEKILSYKQKLNAVISNPACMKVAKLNADLGSLGKINKYNGDKLQEIDFLYTQKKQPNFYQSWQQFIWDYYFWQFIGVSVMWRSSNVLNDSTQLYWLNPANIDYNKGKTRFSKFLFSKEAYNKQQKETITYTYDDGTVAQIPLNQLTFFYDTSNGITGNWYDGLSTLDSLYKVIANSEMALDAKNINLEFSQKFMMNGKNSAMDVSSLPMGDTEKRDAESSIRSGKKVHVVKTPVDINRFVNDIANLKLSESYFDDLFIIASMRGIPKDVIETNAKGSTYENQEKATSKQVDYALSPAGKNLTDNFEYIFGYEDLKMEWTHLAFNQVFEKERQEVLKLKLENEAFAKANGLTI